MLQLNEYRQSPQPPAATPAHSAAILAAALDALPLPVIIVDAELQVVHINAAAGEPGDAVSVRVHHTDLPPGYARRRN